MKLKPIYIYLSVIIVALITLVIISNSDDNTKVEKAVSNSNIPADENRNSFEGQSNIGPSGSNVSSTIRTKMNDLDEYVTANPNDTLKVKEYADLLAVAHNQEKALLLYNSILDIDPNRTDILTNLAIMYYNKNDFIESKIYNEKILKIDPKHAEAKYNLGVIEAKIGDVEAAKKQWNDLLTNHPNTKMSDMAKESLEQLKSK